MAMYASVDQVRIRMHQNVALNADQSTMLEEIITAASRGIDRVCRVIDDNFQAVGVAAIKYFTAFGDPFLRIPPCTSITTVAVKASAASTTYTDWDTPTTAMAGDGDWIPARGDPADPIYNTPPYNLLMIEPTGEHAIFLDGSGRPVVKITAVWGAEASVPDDIREACCMQSIKWYKRYQGGQSTELGGSDFGEITYGRGLSKEVMEILRGGHRVVPLYGGAV